MKRIVISLIVLLVITLAACADRADLTGHPSASPSPSATPDPVELIQKNIEMQETLNALQASSYQVAAHLTATYLAPTWDVVTQQAAISATHQSGSATAAFIATSTSAAKTEIAEQWTPTPQYTGTVEAAAASAKATALYAESVSVELALERERLMNQVWAVTPWAALVVVLLFSLALAWRWSQIRVIQRDLRGDAPLIITGATVYDADRNPGPVLDMTSGKPAIPTLAPPELQAATTSRDQLVDLATRGSFSGPQRRSAARRLTNSQPTPHPGQPALPPIEVVDAVEVREWIDEAEQKLLIDGGAE